MAALADVEHGVAMCGSCIGTLVARRRAAELLPQREPERDDAGQAVRSLADEYRW